MSTPFDAYHRWLGIPPEKQPPSHYALLAIEPFEGNADVIESAADQRMAHLRNFQAGEHSDLSQKLLNEVAAAKICLLNPDKKAAYDRTLREKIEAAKRVVPKAVSTRPQPAGQPARVATGEETSMAAIARRRRSQLGPIVAGGVIAVLVIGGVILWAMNSGEPPTDDGSDVAQQGNSSAPPITDEGLDGAVLPVDVDTRPDDVPPQPDPDDTPSDGDDSPTQPADPPEDGASQDPPGTTPPDGTTDPPPTDPVQPPVEDPPLRQPLPSSTAQAVVTRQLDEIYKFAELKTAAKKLTLAGQLLKLAGEAKETPAEQFVLLRKAMELAAAGGDADVMLGAIDAIAVDFEVDALAVKHKILPKVAQAATDAAKIALLAEGSLAVVDEATACHRYDVAFTVIEAAYRACQRSEGRDYRKQIYDRRKEVQKLHAAWQQFQEALATLKTTPDDAEANLAAGRWYCFTLGDWQQALPCLSKCSDAALKSAAALELATPSDTPQQIAAGDAWWTAAEGAADEAKAALLHRAGHWYEQARPNVKSVLLKGKLDQRLAEIAKIEQPETQVAVRPSPRPNSQSPKTPVRLRVRPQNKLAIRVFDNSVFEAQFGGQFPVANNRSEGGIAEASSTSSERGSSLLKVFRGARTGESWIMKASSGIFGAQWPDPPVGRYILIFSRTSGSGKDPWGNAVISVNQGRPTPLLNVAGNTVAAIDLGQAAAIKSIAISINGKTHPGIVGIEIHEAAVVTPRADTDPIKPPPADTAPTVEPAPISSQPLLPPTGRFTRPVKIQPLDSTNATILRTLTGHTGSVRDLAFSPDGSTLISAAADKTIRSWNVATGQLRGMLPTFKQNKLRFVLSPKGDLLAVTSGDHTIGLWDTAKGQLRATLNEHKEPVSAIAFSPDGSLLASGSEDATAILWDVAKGRPKWAAEGHEKKVSALAFSPDGSTLASWAGGQPVRLWDVAAGELRRTLDARAQYAPAIAFSPNGLLLACVGNQGVSLIKAETGDRVYSLPAHQSYVESVAFSPDGSTLGYNVSKSTAKLWDVATGKLQRTLDENPTGVFAVAFSPDGSLFACGNKDGTITLWGTDPNAKPPKEQPGDDPPALPSKPDDKVSTTGLTTDKDGWIALAPLVQKDRDTKDAGWKWDGKTAAFSATKARARVSFPVVLGGSYELQTRVTIVRAKETTAIYLPITNTQAAVLDMKGDSGNRESPTATIKLKGLKPDPQPQGNVSMNIGTEYALSCKVARSRNNVAIEIRRDGQILYQWAGLVSQVAQRTLMRPSTVELYTAYYTSSKFTDLRLKMYSGKAAPLFPE